MPDRSASVEIARDDRGLVFRLSKAGVDYEDALRYQLFVPPHAGLPPLSTADEVCAYAESLTNSLNAHPAVRSELQQIFRTAAPNRASLEFVIGAPEGESYRWETLLPQSARPPRFLALGGMCSMRRIAYAGGAPGPRLRIFALPVRMVAFLSASGVDAVGQFDAIAGAIGAARERGLMVEADLYLGEQALLDQARADIAAGKLPGVGVAPIPDSAIGLEKVLLGAPVQIVHCFCHGYADAGVELLEFASISDHDTEAPAGSIHLSAERLNQALLTGGTVWLTVLNSCSGATPTTGMFSMAAALAKSGSPVAIGMAEPLPSGDANLFAQGFYGKALQIVADAVNGLPVGETTRIDFAPAVDEARKLLNDEVDEPRGAGDQFGHWSLPVLYQREAPLTVGRAADDAMRDRVALVAEALRSFTARTPTALRDNMLALLDKPPAVPRTLRPDQFGDFP